ncbi:carboxylesterase family protein [Actinomadura kijaniata]|uniref:Carboxylic ester hydrolase n=1 Tax=Actinomadura namibiensis TaxID=182080 RepID=A0A7W3LT89_ACTNM|nr:carboxylesterase family protein [Actinomadura namibiensis]MBA8953855.1 para-nitrobenzyl esterase [Actinomadura namibiensis]
MIVETAYGEVEGAGGAFLGIPFARAPRFRPPLPPEPWTGVRPAREYGPAVPQLYEEELGTMLGLPAFPTDERGCLNLNVWTPSAEGARPVMVWLPGGAFRSGAGRDPVYDGRRLAVRNDVVVVTVNYRVGPLGFLYLDEESANVGLLDQVAALEWVRDNIAGFGGDPGDVTVFGQSAGAMSIATMLAMPAARGLFHKAIMQSGGGEFALARERAEAVAAEFGKTLGALSPWDAPVEELLRAQEEVGAAMLARGEGHGLPCLPVVDGTVLPVLPLEAARAGTVPELPVIVGANDDEGRLFTMGSPDADAVAAHIAETMFAGPARRLAEALAGRGRRVWHYRFAWRSTAFGGALGAAHSMEVPFVFDNLDAPGVTALTGPNPPQGLADRMSGTWAAFARDGAPPEPWEPFTGPGGPVATFN